jgi:cation:H+ antiporter
MSPGTLWFSFSACAALVVLAGVLIGRLSGEVGERLRLGRAWSGAVLLSIATTLPELVTTTTAVFRGAVALALGGVVGTMTFNLFILVLVDLIEPEGTSIYNRLSKNHLATGLLGCVLLGLLIVGLAMGVAFPTRASGGGHRLIALIPPLLVIFFLAGQYILFRMAQGTALEEKAMKMPTVFDRFSLPGLLLLYAAVAAVILLAGRGLAISVERIAAHYRWGATFAGATLLGVVTSLPEISNAVACARQKEFDLSLGNVLGANAMVLFVLALAGLFHTTGPLLAAVSARDGLSAISLAGVAIVMQGTLLGALAVQSATRVWRVGLASLALAVLYGLSLVVAYQFSVGR